MFLVVSGLVQMPSKDSDTFVLARSLPVNAMLVTVISYFEVATFNEPVQVAAVLVPVMLIFWKQFVAKLSMFILISLGISSFIFPFWGISYVVKKDIV